MISFYKSFISISLVGILSSNNSFTIQKEKIHKIEYRQCSGGKGGDFSYLEQHQAPEAVKAAMQNAFLHWRAENH